MFFGNEEIPEPERGGDLLRLHSHPAMNHKSCVGKVNFYLRCNVNSLQVITPAVVMMPECAVNSVDFG